MPRSARTRKPGSGSPCSASSRSSAPSRGPLTVSVARAATAACASARVAVLDGEAQAPGVPREAQQPRRVVDEAGVVEHPEPACLDVLAAVRGLDQAPAAGPGHPQGQGVDGEVAATEVLLDARGRNGGQRPGVGVALPAGAGQVVGESVQRHGEGLEAVVHLVRRAQQRRDGLQLPVDHQVQIQRLGAQKQVADGPADEIDALGAHPSARAAAEPRAMRRSALSRTFAIGSSIVLRSCRAPRRVGAKVRLRLPPMPPVSRRWLWRGLLAAAVALVIAGAAVAFVLTHAPGNVSHPNLEFTTPTTSTAPAPRPRAKKQVNNFQWPWYGLNAGRTRFFAAPANLAPPLHVGWTFTDGALLEFPPVIYHETMFVLDDDCAARAIDIRTGHVKWFRKIGTLCAASPAIAPKAGLVLMPALSQTGHSPGNGRFVALSMKQRPHRVVAPGRRGQRVLPHRPRDHRLLRRSGRHPLLPERRQRPPVLDLPRQRAPSRPARRCRAASSTSATTRAARMPSTR